MTGWETLVSVAVLSRKSEVHQTLVVSGLLLRVGSSGWAAALHAQAADGQSDREGKTLSK